MILFNEWERESAILMILGVHATKFLLCTPKTPIDNGFHSLSRFRHFITEWIDSRARHEYTRTQNGNITKHKQLDSNIDSSSRSFIRDSFDANQKSRNIESIDYVFFIAIDILPNSFFSYMWNSIRELYIFHHDLYILSFLSVTFFLEEIKRYK